MSSPTRTSLSQVPVHKRRQAAATLGLFATLFVAIAAVAATGADTMPIKVFVVVAGLVAVFLGLLAWGVASSIKADEADRNAFRAEQDLDAAIEQAVAARGGSMCDCGHDHDPTELHVPDDPCARDGHGSGCTHSCETCILSTLKRTSERSAAPAAAARPTPGPKRPSPAPR